MVESKPSRPPEGNQSKNLNDGNKVQAYKPKKYIGKNTLNKPIPEPESKT